MSEQLVVEHCSPTLAGIKTGNLFSCAYQSKAELYASVRTINRKLGSKGIRVLPLRYSSKRALIYVYRPDVLNKDLSRKEATELLKEAGYEKNSPSYCISELARRLRTETDFPHEVGLFLSYPPEDVRAFIENKGAECKCVGCWKVYGNEQEAQRTFQRYKNCTNRFCQQWRNGTSIEELTAAN